MSQNAQRELSGILFRNDRKEQPNHPDMKGSITIEGREYWLSGWTKQGQKGKFLSLAAKPKEKQESAPAAKGDRFYREPAQPAKPAIGGGKFDYDDEIPFAPEFR